MKEEKRESVLRELRSIGCLKNDGNGFLHCYYPNRGVWYKVKDAVARKVIAEQLRSKGIKLTVGELREIANELTENVDFLDEGLNREPDPYWIVDEIGRVNLLTLEREPFCKEAYDRLALNFRFQKDIEKPPSVWALFLMSSLEVPMATVSSSLVTQLFLEFLGVAVSNLTGLKKAMVLLGPPNCGKSLILKFIAEIVGTNHYVPLSFRDMGERFRGSLMEGKPLILSHEMNCAELANIDMVKAIISGDPIIVEAKGVQPKIYVPSVKIVLAANSLPLLRQVDAGGAFCERLAILRFPKSIRERDPQFLEKLLEERDAIMSLAIKTLPALIKRKLCFVEEPTGTALLERYRAESSSVLAFVHEKLEPIKDKWIPNTQVYESYRAFCRENLFRPLKERHFRKELVQMGAEFGKVRPHPNDNPLHCLNLESIKEAGAPWKSKIATKESPQTSAPTAKNA